MNSKVKNILIDDGNNDDYAVIDVYLKKQSVKVLDAVIATHPTLVLKFIAHVKNSYLDSLNLEYLLDDEFLVGRIYDFKSIYLGDTITFFVHFYIFN